MSRNSRLLMNVRSRAENEHERRITRYHRKISSPARTLVNSAVLAETHGYPSCLQTASLTADVH